VAPVAARRSDISTSDALTNLAELAGVSGYEEQVSAWLAERLKRFNPQVDNLGNVMITLGSGAPHRLLLTPIDEPGYVVSAITPEGYLRVQRLPQPQPHPWFDLLHSAQPIQVHTRSGKAVPGVVAGLSTHLHRDRGVAPGERTDDIERLYIDVGARSAAEVRELGIDLLDPLTLEKQAYSLANGELTAPFISDRVGAAALVRFLEEIDPNKITGALTVTFVVRRYMGNQGLNRLLKQVEPDEIVFVQRLENNNTQAEVGAGALVAGLEGGSGELAEELLARASEERIATQAAAAEPVPRGRYTGLLPFPAKAVVVGLPVKFPQTPAEIVSHQDLYRVVSLVHAWLRARGTGVGGGWGGSRGEGKFFQPTVEFILPELAGVYGVSGNEEPVSEKIRHLLPPWAQEWATLDAKGNLIVPFGQRSEKPSLVFVAHMDEIGWTVKEIRDDGRLVLDRRGGFLEEHFLGHVVYIHTPEGQVPAVLELPENYRTQKYEPVPNRDHIAYTGAHTTAEAEALGIRVGDSVTVPKKYRKLAGTRVSARSFDDRVGSTALIAALGEIDPAAIDREVTFVWAVEEEIGLEGAKHFAARAAVEGGIPDYVFAVDTFVSSDSPLESPRFAGARLGEGFVVRAVDNSNVTPRALVDRVVEIARQNSIPVHYGVTSGGNDGAAFVPYEAIDIPLGWPLRYSHSAAEVTDLKDLEALARIVAALVKEF
jgi:putative aminopeptidase FrvX